MNILAETENLKLEHLYEAVYLIEKSTGKILFEDEFYGDPSCGLIDENEDWAIVAGEHLSIWTSYKWKRTDHEQLKWIHDLRSKDPYLVEILIDPFGENSSIWEIHTRSFEFKKIRDFDDYRGREYSDDVIW